MKAFDEYLKLQAEIFAYFSYEEGYQVFPLSDCREYFWAIDAQDENICFATTEDELKSQSGRYYEVFVHLTVHLPKSIYVGEEFTMICVDTQTDGNKFLQIFSNANKREFQEEK